MDEEEMESNEYQEDLEDLEEREVKPEEKQGKPEEKESWFITKISLLFLAAGVAGIIVPFPWWGTILLWLAWEVTMVLAIWGEWAPMDFNVGFVEEGTIRAAAQGGEISAFFLRYVGHHLASEEEAQGDGPALRKWDVIEDAVPIRKSIWRKLFGGLVWFGLYPFRKAIDFPFEWFNLHADGKLHWHKERITSVLVKWSIYGFPILNIEDKDNIPLDIVFTIPMRIINPYEALFVVRRWLAMVMGLILPVLRRFIAEHGYHELLSMKPSDSEKPSSPEEGDLREELWRKIIEALKEEKSLSTIKKIDKHVIRIFGVELDGEGAGFNSVDPNKTWRRKTTMVWEEEQKAKATIIKGEAEGTALAKKVTTAIRAIAKQMAGLGNLTDDQLTVEQWQIVQENVDPAWDRYYDQKKLDVIQPTNKVVLTGIGDTRKGKDKYEDEEKKKDLTLREVIRQEIGEKIKNSGKEKDEDKEE